MAGPPPLETPPPRGRRDVRGERRRAELLDAAIRLIGTHGMDGVTHRAVAAAAGAPAASTSYYFRSKDELIHEALQLIAARDLTELARRREGLGAEIDSIDATTEALASWIEAQVRPEGMARVLAQYQLQLEAARREEARDILMAWKSGLDELAQTAMRSLGAKDVDTAGILLVCAIDGLRLRILSVGQDELDGPGLRATIRALLVGLVAA